MIQQKLKITLEATENSCTITVNDKHSRSWIGTPSNATPTEKGDWFQYEGVGLSTSECYYLEDRFDGFLAIEALGVCEDELLREFEG